MGSACLDYCAAVTSSLDREDTKAIYRPTRISGSSLQKSIVPSCCEGVRQIRESFLTVRNAEQR
jgi:hypothetical protein